VCTVYKKKSQTGFHVPGPVAVIDDSTFCRIWTVLVELYKSLLTETLKILIPLMAWYLFVGCCNDQEHCSNRKDNGYQEKMLGKLEHLRQTMKGELNRLGIKNYWVLNSVRALSGTTPGTGTGEEILSGLCLCGAADGIHLTETGNIHMLNTILSAEKFAGSQYMGPDTEKPGFLLAGVHIPGRIGGENQLSRQPVWTNSTQAAPQQRNRPATRQTPLHEGRAQAVRVLLR